MNNFHAFTVTYIGATNTRGSRVKIKSERFEQSVTIPYDYHFANTLQIAVAYLNANGYEVVGQEETKNSYIILSTTFKPLKDEANN